jgi:lysozyme family protein
MGEKNRRRKAKMTDYFPECLEFVLQYEGGFSNNRHDPGAATNMGVTRNTLAAWRGRPVSTADVRNLGRGEVSEIYRKNYWAAAGCDKLKVGDCLAVFDASVNNGVGRAIDWKHDAQSLPFHDYGNFIENFTARRLDFDRGLRIWRYFGKGWSCRIEACRAHALEMEKQYA